MMQLRKHQIQPVRREKEAVCQKYFEPKYRMIKSAHSEYTERNGVWKDRHQGRSTERAAAATLTTEK